MFSNPYLKISRGLTNVCGSTLTRALNKQHWQNIANPRQENKKTVNFKKKIKANRIMKTTIKRSLTKIYI